MFFKEDAAKKQTDKFGQIHHIFFSFVLNFGDFHKAEVLLEQLHKSRERADKNRANSKCDRARYEKRAAGESENYNILFQQKNPAVEQMNNALRTEAVQLDESSTCFNLFSCLFPST